MCPQTCLRHWPPFDQHRKHGVACRFTQVHDTVQFRAATVDTASVCLRLTTTHCGWARCIVALAGACRSVWHAVHTTTSSPLLPAATLLQYLTATPLLPWKTVLGTAAPTANCGMPAPATAAVLYAAYCLILPSFRPHTDLHNSNSSTPASLPSLRPGAFVPLGHQLHARVSWC